MIADPHAVVVWGGCLETGFPTPITDSFGDFDSATSQNQVGTLQHAHGPRSS
ncbi:MAG: hypothetical protein RL240_2217 [Planctomycetota bacterium]|jgi:hypothetical protein